jgi:hypothetical protein
MDDSEVACDAAAMTAALAASGSVVFTLAIVPVIPLHGWLGAVVLYVTAFAVMLVPHGTATVLFEATVQFGAETVVPPLKATPVPLALKASMQDEAVGAI